MSFCPACGSAQGNDGAFCPKCGSAIATSVTSTSLQRTAPPPLDPAQVQVASQLAMGTAAAVIHQRIVSNTCPRCGSGMAVVMRRSRFGLALFLFGLMIVWIPIFGWVFGTLMMVTGFYLRWGTKGRVHYQCPGCNYSN